MSNDDLLEAWKWLDDCGGVMALSNHPGADMLIQAGLAKKGGLDSLGRRTLVQIKGTYPPGYAPTKSSNVQDLVDFFRDLPSCPQGSDTPKNMAERALKLAKTIPNTRGTGFYRGTWLNLIEWIPEMIGFEGNNFKVADHGGVVIMCPKDWVHLEDNYSQTRYYDQDEYILGGIIGMVRDIPVLVTPFIPEGQVHIVNQSFTYISPFQNLSP